MKRYKTLLEAAGVRDPIAGTRKARTSTRKIEPGKLRAIRQVDGTAAIVGSPQHRLRAGARETSRHHRPRGRCARSDAPSHALRKCAFA